MSYAFDIKNSMDLFREFRSRTSVYRKDNLSSGNAVICAILGWHIVEWIYQEFDMLSGAYNSKREFQDHIKKECPSLGYMQDIANGSKHRGITFYEPDVKRTDKHQGAFSSCFSKDFDVSCLKLELETGEVAYFDEELDKVEEFLTNFYLEKLEINV